MIEEQMRGEGHSLAGFRWLVAMGIAMAALALALFQPGSAHAARGIDFGLTDGELTSDPSVSVPSLDHAREANADLVILYVAWAGVAPANPSSGFNGANPGDPEYNWSNIDAAVRNASARGFKILMAVTQA